MKEVKNSHIPNKHTNKQTNKKCINIYNYKYL